MSNVIKESEIAFIALRRAQSYFDEKTQTAREDITKRVCRLVLQADTAKCVEKIILYKNGDVSVCENRKDAVAYTLSTDTGRVSIDTSESELLMIHLESVAGITAKRLELGQAIKDADVAGVFRSIDPSDEDLGLEIEIQEEEEEEEQEQEAKKLKTLDENEQ